MVTGYFIWVLSIVKVRFGESQGKVKFLREVSGVIFMVDGTESDLFQELLLVRVITLINMGGIFI